MYTCKKKACKKLVCTLIARGRGGADSHTHEAPDGVLPGCRLVHLDKEVRDPGQPVPLVNIRVDIKSIN